MPAIYTRTGDKGTTGLFGGSRVTKQSLRVEAYGTVDEGNAALGDAKANLEPGPWRDRVHAIQQRLFVLGAELASDAEGAAILGNKISTDDIADLERLIDDCLAITGPQRSFVVPGRDPVSAPFHLARTVIRRAERRTLTLAESEPVRPEVIKYLNRLSDAVYALARLTETWGDLARVESVVRAVVEKYWPQLQPGAPAEPEAAPGRWAAMREHEELLADELTLEVAKRLATAAEARAKELGVAIVVAAVDAGGNLVLLHRMPEAILVSVEAATNKAWTACAFKQPTSELGPLAAEGGPFPGLDNFNQGRVVLFGGGAPLTTVAGKLLGAIGVSGGSADEDCDIVNTAVNTVMGVQK